VTIRVCNNAHYRTFFFVSHDFPCNLMKFALSGFIMPNECTRHGGLDLRTARPAEPVIFLFSRFMLCSNHKCFTMNLWPLVSRFPDNPEFDLGITGHIRGDMQV
jgi:hypothetical protein